MGHNDKDIWQKAEVLARLRIDVARLERGYSGVSAKSLSVTPSLDACFETGALPLGAIHEFVAANRDEKAAANGFIAALLGKLPDASGLVWITKRRSVFPPGLAMFGLDCERIAFIELHREQDALWAAEEALRCKAVSAVIADITNIDLSASRRLQLAAEQSGAAAFLVRVNPKSLNSTACVSRWKIRHAASLPPDGLPGVGFPRWDIELLKVRNGRTGNFTLEWRGAEFVELATTRPAISENIRKAGVA